MRTRTYFAVLSAMTISRWSFEKGGMSTDEKLAALADKRVGGNVRFKFEVCKENILARFKENEIPFIIKDDDTVVTNGASSLIEMSYKDVRPFVERLIKNETAAVKKAAANSQVFNVVKFTSTDVERVYELIDIIEEFDEDYFCVSYKDKKLVKDKRDNHEFKTRVMHAVACPEMGIDVESAVAKWHSSHKTLQEVAVYNTKLAADRELRKAPKENVEHNDGD